MSSDSLDLYLVHWPRRLLAMTRTRLSAVGRNRKLAGHHRAAALRAVQGEDAAQRFDPVRRIAAFVRDELGVGSSVASPVLVEGRLWGVLYFHSKLDRQPFAPDTESRLTGFTELVATAIANAESLAALAASRARIVAAADEARRRIERDLHDGIQQQLVSLMLDLRTVQASVPAELGELDGKLSPIAERLAGVSDQVRAISRGVHPAILSRSGLEPALRSLARRSVLPVELQNGVLVAVVGGGVDREAERMGRTAVAQAA